MEASKLLLFPVDAWADAAIRDIQASEAGQRAHWTELIVHAMTASAAKPSDRWLKTAELCVEAVGRDEFERRLLDWMSVVNVPRTSDVAGNLHPLSWNSLNADVLKGLVWTIVRAPSDSLVRLLTTIAVAAFRKVPGQGPRSIKVGNACIHSLGLIGSPLSLAQLALLKSRIKLASAQKEIDKALGAVAGRLGMSREELEEASVPTFGLTDVGRLEEPLGDYTAEAVVADSGKATLVWRKADGKIQKSVPAAIKSDFGDELKDLKAALKDVEKMVSAQRERLDGLFTSERQWPAAVWRERFLDHPVVGILARRLIWTFRNADEVATGAWLQDTIVDVDDEPIDWVEAEGTTVQLWHPLGRPMDDVLSWRHWLERHEIRQPFKQAHREVYLLTDAERRTATYSNRFAAHVVRQHQFHALCAARGWKDQLRLMVDAEVAPPTRRYESWGLRAEFWVEAVGDDYGADTNDAGVFHYLSTDQVRFYRLEADRHIAHATGGRYFTEGLETPLNQPLPLEVIPPIVFSEVMRDVDLFVGVASVGNDPAWADGGPGGRYREYWQTFSFGDLTPSAQTRKQVLERLIPRLKIGSRCTFSEKFLVVRGDFRTYKIHLGSGNIMMEPNDQYLCIVPDSAAATTGDKVFLPFEGDRTLSIILSKAMLLADDRSITDRTILTQIHYS